MTRSRRNWRSTRGENWPLVRTSTTTVIEKTSPVKEIIALITAPRKLRAPSGGPGNRKALPVSPTSRSTRAVP